MTPPITRFSTAASEPRDYVLDEGIVKEASPDRNCLTLWLPGVRERHFHQWQRISEVAHSRFIVEPGYAASRATLVCARQRTHGLLSRFFRLFRRSKAQTWVLPNGETVEQSGPRQDDVLLVRAENDAGSIDEGWVKAHWPLGKCRRLGANLYLVAGVPAPAVRPEPESAQECPHAAAQALLAAARASGDARREATALADLGAAYMHGGFAEHAAGALGDALRLAVQLGDHALQGDVLCNLGWLTMTAGNPRRAVEIFERALRCARQAFNPFIESTALQRIGLAHVRLNDPLRALEVFTQALAVARAAAFRKDQADLHWYIAIEYGELGQREQALIHGHSAVDLMSEMSNPKAAWFANHLEKYRTGQTATTLGETEDEGAMPAGLSLGEPPVSGIWTRMPASSSSQDPSILRMAVSAVKSMARFVGSGFKTAPAQTIQYRLRTCAACVHHTGLRCRLCGCFTSAKARLAHEECPIGKWPD